MSLVNNYVYVYGQLPDLFDRIKEGQAPNKFTLQLLKDWGFSSSNHRAFIPLLKALGFLSADGTPTTRYHEYRSRAQSRQVMADALREAYSDIFLIKENPSESDRALIEGKFKSTHNTSDRTAKLMANTFYSLLELADLSRAPSKVKEDKKTPVSKEDKEKPTPLGQELPVKPLGLHYNIQIHLPATKDVEVYNAIFKSLKEHLIE